MATRSFRAHLGYGFCLGSIVSESIAEVSLARHRKHGQVLSIPEAGGLD
jgi:hypothetical protein